MNHPSLKRCNAVRWPALHLWKFVTTASAFLLPVCQLRAHDVQGSQAQQSDYMHFIQENALTIQIVSGVILVTAIALFVLMRKSKARQNKDAQPPAPGDPQAPK